MSRGTNSVVRFRNRIYVPYDRKIRKMILDESHKSKLSIHSGDIKMYYGLKKMFWWPRMKREVA